MKLLIFCYNGQSLVCDRKNLDCGIGLREYVALALVVYLVLSYLWMAFYVAVLTEPEQLVAREVKKSRLVANLPL